MGGELWAVHGGGFYNPQKYLVAPSNCPTNCIGSEVGIVFHLAVWFCPISVLYHAQAGSYMIDQPGGAVARPGGGAGPGHLAGGWLVYDGLCRLLMRRSILAVCRAVLCLCGGGGLGLTHWLSGRAAFIHVGAMLATTMSGNVFSGSSPARKTVAAMRRGDAPDPIHGQRAKRRSVHNNYLTLPVLFCMISNHYALTYNHPQAWLVLALILLAGVLIRHFSIYATTAGWPGTTAGRHCAAAGRVYLAGAESPNAAAQGGALRPPWPKCAR